MVVFQLFEPDVLMHYPTVLLFYVFALFLKMFQFLQKVIELRIIISFHQY